MTLGDAFGHHAEGLGERQAFGGQAGVAQQCPCRAKMSSIAGHSRQEQMIPRMGWFAVTLESEGPDPDQYWVELLANGLTFDLAGLAPGNPSIGMDKGHMFDLPEGFDPAGCEGITLSPGPHLISGGPMIPVLRCLAWLAAELAGLEHLQAIAWRPARTVCGPSYFHDAVMRWIGGGAFPALGLTALVPQEDGSLLSEGLALFTGQELLVEAHQAVDQQQAAKVALRLLHWLVENGRVDRAMSLTGPSGETLHLVPRPNDGLVCVQRGSG
jgi:hypothetical protein